MNELEFASAIVSSKIELPKDRTTLALLIHASVDTFKGQPFDPLKITEYCQTLDRGRQAIEERREKERKAVETKHQAQVQAMMDGIWSIITPSFGWYYPQRNQTISLRGKLKWAATHLISGPVLHTSGDVKHVKIDCPEENHEFELQPLLADWVREYATKLVQSNETPKVVMIFQELLRVLPSAIVRCPRASPIVHPNERCSVFTSGSYEVLRCHEAHLELKPR